MKAGIARLAEPVKTISTSVNRTTPWESLPELLTVEEFATVSGVGKGIVYALVQSGALPVVRFGRLIRISKAALREAK